MDRIQARNFMRCVAAGALFALAAPFQVSAESADAQSAIAVDDVVQSRFGNSRAPTKIYMFAPYTCPHCAAFFMEKVFCDHWAENIGGTLWASSQCGRLERWKMSYIDNGRVQLSVIPMPMNPQDVIFLARHRCANTEQESSKFQIMTANQLPRLAKLKGRQLFDAIQGQAVRAQISDASRDGCNKMIEARQFLGKSIPFVKQRYDHPASFPFFTIGDSTQKMSAEEMERGPADNFRVAN